MQCARVQSLIQTLYCFFPFTVACHFSIHFALQMGEDVNERVYMYFLMGLALIESHQLCHAEGMKLIHFFMPLRLLTMHF